MTDYPHLILHKVRGEPAFDIATKMAVGNDVWWIIPTSGHRAYPFRYWPLDEMFYEADPNQTSPFECPAQGADEVPSDWPDHYPANTQSLTKRVETARKLIDLGITDEEFDAFLKERTAR